VGGDSATCSARGIASCGEHPNDRVVRIRGKLVETTILALGENPILDCNAIARV
jgi:hypothetical protein